MSRLWVLIFVIALTGPVHAEEHWVRITGSYSAFSLRNIPGQPLLYRGYEIDRNSLNNGAGFGFASGVDFERPWAVSFSYRRTRGSAHGVSSTSELSADVPLNEFLLMPAYFISRSPESQIGVGVGVGVVFVEGETAIVREGSAYLTRDVKTATPLFDWAIFADIRIARGLSLHAQGGYRRAIFEDFNLLGPPIEQDDPGGGIEFDFSGLSMQLGLKFTVPVKG